MVESYSICFKILHYSNDSFECKRAADTADPTENEQNDLFMMDVNSFSAFPHVF